MKEKFEKIIKQKIENFIDTNEVSYKPEHWQMLLAKKKKAKKRRFAYWRWAAVIILFILAGGVSTMLYNSEIPLQIPEQKTIVESENDTLQKKNLIEEETQITTVNKEEKILKNSNKTIRENTEITNTKKKEKNTLLAVSKNKETLTEKEDSEIQTVNTSEIAENKPNKIIKNREEESTENKRISPSDSVLIAEKSNKKSDLQKEMEKKEPLQIQQKKRFITLAINASPIVNYASSTGNTGLGYSGGVSIEIPLFNKFDIQAELVYANHKIDYLNRKGDLLMYSNSEIVGLSGRSLTPKVDLSSKEATVNMIEIPVSIKYHFKMQKQKLFVSAGISSTSILKEKINSIYNVSERIVKNNFSDSNKTTTYSYVTNERTISTEKTTNHFHLIGAFQMSFGGEFQVGKNQSIVVEPYYKHFVRPVTTRKTTFSNVGVRLQYRFNFKK